jgi:hypothetical protein
MRRWYGLPQTNVRLLREHHNAIRAEARRRGVPASSIIKEIVGAWYLHGIGTLAAAPSPQSEPVNALPRTRASQPMSLAEKMQQGGFQSTTRASGGTISPRRQGMSDRPQRQRMRDW